MFNPELLIKCASILKFSEILTSISDSVEFKSQLKIFVNDKNFENELQNKAHALATKMSGADSFGDNWNNLIESLYE